MRGSFVFSLSFQSVKPYGFFFEIAIIFGAQTGKCQDAIIGVGYALLIEQPVAHTPDFVFGGLVGPNLHRTHNRNAPILEFPAIIKIHARFFIGKILGDFP